MWEWRMEERKKENKKITIAAAGDSFYFKTVLGPH
jgi:hypothetical protein